MSSNTIAICIKRRLYVSTVNSNLSKENLCKKKSKNLTTKKFEIWGTQTHVFFGGGEQIPGKIFRSKKRHPVI